MHLHCYLEIPSTPKLPNEVLCGGTCQVHLKRFWFNYRAMGPIDLSLPPYLRTSRRGMFKPYGVQGT
jgi:hypothetical protein